MYVKLKNAPSYQYQVEYLATEEEFAAGYVGYPVASKLLSS